MTPRKIRAEIASVGTKTAPAPQIVTLTRGDGEIRVLRGSRPEQILRREGWKEKA